MCNDEKNPRLEPLTRQHLEYLKEKFPSQQEFLESVFNAITFNLNPGLNILALMSVMYQRFNEGKYGILKQFNAVRFPLSLVGVDNIRYRTPIMKELHETVLSFNMGSKNVNMLNVALEKLGIKVAMTCSCGVVLLAKEKSENFYSSQLLMDMDNYRSVLDRFGYPVKYVSGLGDIPCLTVDATEQDKDIFEQVDQLVEDMLQNVQVDQIEYFDERGIEASKSELIKHVFSLGAILPQEYALKN